MGTWKARVADDADKGSFSDTTSGLTYENVSKEEAVDQQEQAMRRGDDRMEPNQEIDSYSDDTRFNTVSRAVDSKGMEYEERAKPGN